MDAHDRKACAPKAGNKKIIEALRLSGGVITAAAEILGYTRPALSKRINDDPELKAAAEESRETLVDAAETGLFDLIKKRDTTAIIFSLKTRGRSRGYDERWEAEQFRKRLETIENELLKNRLGMGKPGAGQGDGGQEIPPPTPD